MKLSIILFLGIFLLGFLLRYNNYTIYPRHGATFDEFAWTWLGINLIQNKVPESWSPHPQYTVREHLIYQGAAFWLVKPYLEHPPLFGLVAGSYVLLKGAPDMYAVTLGNMRQLALILGILSITMVFLLTKEIYDKKTAYFATLLYATIPTIVIGSRILQNENFLIPVWLLSLLLIYKYIKEKKKVFLYSAGIVAGLISLAKVPWLIVGISLCMLLAYHNKWKDSFVLIGIVLLFFSLYIFYGFYFDKDLYIKLWMLQTARYDITFTGLFSVFTNPLLVDRSYVDGWILFGWISMMIIAKQFRKNVFILIPFFAYLVIYIFAIPDEPSHGWYRYPFYPFLIISIALVLKEEFKKMSFLSIFSILIIGLSLLGLGWKELFGFSLTIYRGFILFTVIPFIYIVWRNKSIVFSRVYLGFWFAIFIGLNILSILQYIE